MPLTITPGSAKASAPVTLSNSLGHEIQFRVILSKCNGHITSASSPMTLANDSTYTVPKGGPGDPHAPRRHVLSVRVSRAGR